jgi:hypothetical protein
LRDYVLPKIGGMPVAAIGTGEVMMIIEPLWSIKPETASRVRGRIESILDYAKARGWRDGENPARWRGRTLHWAAREQASCQSAANSMLNSNTSCGARPNKCSTATTEAMRWRSGENSIQPSVLGSTKL